MFENVYDPFQRWFRPRRLKLFYETFDITADTKVLDLGGGTFFWELAHAEGRLLPRVTVLNILPPRGQLPPSVSWVTGDAKNAPLGNHSFDIVFCNSLIEHLVDWRSQCILADEVRRLAPNYFVQTPDKYFPIEPHFLTPFIHWLPKTARRHLIRNFSVWGLLRRPTQAYVDRTVEELRLLSKNEMRTLFPEAEIKSERVLGLSKSIVACMKTTAV
jgi:SAM-dependent methyltransferase